MEQNDITRSQNNGMIFLHGELFFDSCTIIEQSQESAYRFVNETLVKRNWLLGMRIQQEVLKDQRAEYGVQVVVNLAKALTDKYGKGFTKTNLYHYINFYKAWPNIFHAVSGKFEYLTYMPTQEQLRREIEQQKEFFRLQNEK